jgi:membrane protease YdiL (CAAX protease family)
LWLLVAIAALFWFVMFAPWTKGSFNFWLVMLSATFVLGTTALVLGRNERRELYRFELRHALIGVVSVLLLYAIFWAGRHVAEAILPFASQQIEGIYSTKSQAPHWLIAVLLLCWIGPAEEIFWRGFVQHRLMQRYGSLGGLLFATLLYVLVHIWSGNLMLIAASAVAGAFWGLMFLRFRNVWPGLISHAIWDALIFVLAPV